MTAGTSVARMRNASMRTASVSPSPTSFTMDTADVMNVMKTMASRTRRRR